MTTTAAQKLKAVLGTPDAESAIATAQDAVNAAAEEARWPFVPPGHQASVYQNKAAEADACQAVVDASGTPDPNNYPYLKEEVGVNGVDVAAVAAAVIAKRNLWLGVIDPKIEGTRQSLQKDLEDLDPQDTASIAAANTIGSTALDTINAAVAAALAG